MNIDPLKQTELTEILQIAQDGEIKLKEMSDSATVIAEKWRLKTHSIEKNAPKKALLKCDSASAHAALRINLSIQESTLKLGTKGDRAC